MLSARLNAEAAIAGVEMDLSCAVMISAEMPVRPHNQYVTRVDLKAASLKPHRVSGLSWPLCLEGSSVKVTAATRPLLALAPRLHRAHTLVPRPYHQPKTHSFREGRDTDYYGGRPPRTLPRSAAGLAGGHGRRQGRRRLPGSVRKPAHSPQQVRPVPTFRPFVPPHAEHSICFFPLSVCMRRGLE